MQASIFKYNTVEINDGTNYYAVFAGDVPFGQAETSNIEVKRHRAAPAYVDTDFAGIEFDIEITMVAALSNFHSQIATLKALFDAQDTEERVLIIKDIADSNKQWYLNARCKRSYMKDIATMVCRMRATNPVWESVDEDDATGALTASGQSVEATPAGTLRTEPVITITPTAAKTGGRLYRRFGRIYNAVASALTTYPVEITGGGLDTAALINDTTKSNQINDGTGISDSDTTVDIDTAVGGGLPAVGMGYVGTEQIRWTANSGTQLTGVVRGIGGTTPAAHADNAVIARSKMLANGDDVAVIVNGVEVSRWFGTGANAMNTAATKIWIVAKWAARLEATIEAISDSATTITLQNTSANLETLNSLPVAGIGLFESEIVTWTGKNQKARTLTGVTRAAKFTSAAAHAAGVTLRRVEHDIMLVYGDQTAATPTVDDTQKPIFGLTSTNASWVYSGAFYTSEGKRAGEWTPKAIDSLCREIAKRESQFYGSDLSTSVTPIMPSPATEMGLRIASYLHGTTPKQENAQLEWRLSNPCGFTHANPTGETNRVSAVTWSGKITAQVQYNLNGKDKNWVSVSALAVTAPSAGWNAYAPGNQALGATAPHLRFFFKGPVAAGASNEVDWEIDAITVTLPSAAVPQVSLGAENSSYDLNARLTNNDLTDHWITVRYQMEVGESLEIDCANKRATYLKDNSNAFSAMGWSDPTRQKWFELLANIANTVQMDDTGMTGVTLDLSWHDRQN